MIIIMSEWKMFCEVLWRDELKKWSSHFVRQSDAMIASYMHLKNFRCLQRDSNLCDASAVLSLTELWTDVIKVNLLDSCIPVKGMMSEWKMSCKVWLKDELKKLSSTGSNPVEDTWNFSGVYMRQSLKLSSKM